MNWVNATVPIDIVLIIVSWHILYGAVDNLSGMALSKNARNKAPDIFIIREYSDIADLYCALHTDSMHCPKEEESTVRFLELF